MDKDVKRWITRLKRTLNAIPEGVEIHVGYGTIDIHKEGRMSEHLGSANDGSGINDGSEIDSIITSPNIIPYSEGT